MMRVPVIALLVMSTLTFVACTGSDGDREACGSRSGAAPTCIPADAPVATPIDPAIFVGLRQDGLTLGDPSAKVTIDLYENFLCAQCRVFASDELPAIITAYLKPGIAAVVFHHVPLGGDASVRAHEASQCAADQGRFWPAYGVLYSNFSPQTSAYTIDRLKTLMTSAGVDAATFASCMDGKAHHEAIEATVDDWDNLVATNKDVAFAATTATANQRPLLPLVMVNGTSIFAPTLDELKQRIDAEAAR